MSNHCRYKTGNLVKPNVITVLASRSVAMVEYTDWYAGNPKSLAGTDPGIFDWGGGGSKLWFRKDC